MAEVRRVAATVDAAGDPYDERLGTFDLLLAEYAAAETDFALHLAKRMRSWRPGLFVGDGVAEQRTDARTGAPFLPEDNYGLERAFRLPKSHERHVHGHAHAGVVLVQRGATLVLTLDAHAVHPAPFSAEELLPFYKVREPAVQREARQRGAIMRRARSAKLRPVLLKELQDQFSSLP